MNINQETMCELDPEFLANWKTNIIVHVVGFPEDKGEEEMDSFTPCQDRDIWYKGSKNTDYDLRIGGPIGGYRLWYKPRDLKARHLFKERVKKRQCVKCGADSHAYLRDDESKQGVQVLLTWGNHDHEAGRVFYYGACHLCKVYWPYDAMPI